MIDYTIVIEKDGETKSWTAKSDSAANAVGKLVNGSLTELKEVGKTKKNKPIIRKVKFTPGGQWLIKELYSAHGKDTEVCGMKV